MPLLSSFLIPFYSFIINLIYPTPTILSYKAYYAQERVLDRLKKDNCLAVIPPEASHKTKRSYDKELYK